MEESSELAVREIAAPDCVSEVARLIATAIVRLRAGNAPQADPRRDTGIGPAPEESGGT